MCGTTPSENLSDSSARSSAGTEEVVFGEPSSQAIPPGTFVALLAIDTDFSYYQFNGSSVDETMLDAERIINGVNVIYQRDVAISHELGTVLVRTTAEADPYTADQGRGLLGQFAEEWDRNHADVERDIAHLMTGRDLVGATLGVAFIGVVCNPFSAYGFSQSTFSETLVRRVALTAHELGHNWGADHCNCNIMCSGLGGCAGNITEFATSSINAILNHRNSRNCLVLAEGSAPFLSFNDLSWRTGQRTKNITRFTTPSGSGELPRGNSGALVDFTTGERLPVTLTVSGGDWMGDRHASQGAPAARGTDAAEIFRGIVDATGVVSYSGPDLVLAFDGLETNLVYNVAVYGNRDRARYANRITETRLSGATDFVNQSSFGSDFSGPHDSTTRIVNGDNTTNGYVARFTRIEPGSDRSFKVVISDGGSDVPPRFYANAVFLEGLFPGENRAPVVDAGRDQFARPGATITLAGQASDDQQPPAMKD